MNGELAQLAALVSHARAVIAGREKDELTLANSTFQFVHSLRFERARRLLGIELATFVASSPSGWYDHLRRAGVDSIELVVWSGEGEFAAHVLSALSGGGNWGIRTSGAGSPSLWTARWSPDRRDDPQRRIWAVAYRGRRAAAPTSRGSDLSAADRLRDAIHGAVAFARDAQLSSWADWLGEAELRLTAEPVRYEYHPDMLPHAGYDLSARKLLSACEKAWVFGGMGSWNDLGFAEANLAARYAAVTEALYQAVTTGVASAVNSFPATGDASRAA